MNRIDKLLEFLEEDPADAFTMFALATEYVKAENLKEARSYFEKLVAEHPDYVGTYYHLGKLYEQIGLRDDAFSTYDAGIQVATKIRDLHSKSELQAARMNLEVFEDE